MKVTVEIPETVVVEVCEITGIERAGPAIRKLLADTLQAQRRAIVAGKFLTGEWSAALEGFEATRESDRSQAKTLSEQWRD